jgi:hypothetical protein
MATLVTASKAVEATHRDGTFEVTHLATRLVTDSMVLAHTAAVARVVDHTEVVDRK